MVDGNWVKYRFIKVIARSKTNLAVSNGILTQDFSSQSKRTTYKINYENINNLMDTTNYIMLQHKDIYQYEMKTARVFLFLQMILVYLTLPNWGSVGC